MIDATIRVAGLTGIFLKTHRHTVRNNLPLNGSCRNDLSIGVSCPRSTSIDEKPISQKQKDFILKISGRNGLTTEGLEKQVNKLFNKGLVSLDRVQASKFIQGGDCHKKLQGRSNCNAPSIAPVTSRQRGLILKLAGHKGLTIEGLEKECQRLFKKGLKDLDKVRAQDSYSILTVNLCHNNQHKRRQYNVERTNRSTTGNHPKIL
jgi:hypothetical protein